MEQGGSLIQQDWSSSITWLFVDRGTQGKILYMGQQKQNLEFAAANQEMPKIGSKLPEARRHKD